MPSHLKGCEHVFVYYSSKKYNFKMFDVPLTKIHRQDDNLSNANSLISRSYDIAQSYEIIISNHREVLYQCPSIKYKMMCKAAYRYGVAGSKSNVLRITYLFSELHGFRLSFKGFIFGFFCLLPIGYFERWRINFINRRIFG